MASSQAERYLLKKADVFPARPFWQKFLLVFLLFIAICYFCRLPILRAMGNYLDVGVEPQKVEALYILGGSPHDRGLAAIEVYKDSLCDMFVCTGGNVHGTLIAYGVDMKESELSARFLMNQGLPASKVRMLSSSTSTFEESIEILDDCKSNGYQKIAVISSAYHTRRVRWIFNRKFENSGIEVLVYSAPPTNYNPDEWWKSENGMLFFFNEIVKIGYYHLQY